MPAVPANFKVNRIRAVSAFRTLRRSDLVLRLVAVVARLPRERLGLAEEAVLRAALEVLRLATQERVGRYLRSLCATVRKRETRKHLPEYLLCRVVSYTVAEI